MSKNDFRVEEATHADFPVLASIILTCFADWPVETFAMGPPTPENIQVAAQRYLQANRIYGEKYSRSAFVKCVHTDPATGVETIVGSAQWYIYPRKRTLQEINASNYLFCADYLTESGDQEKKGKVTAFFKPFVDKRVELMGHEPYGLLLYMSILPEWRRRGLATMCVQWGLDQCRELGIPAYLEASHEGVPVYQKLGFKIVENTSYDWEGDKGYCPIMIKYSDVHART